MPRVQTLTVQQGFRPFTRPRALAGVRMGRGMRGLGSNICLDQNQNSVDCSSPECTYGDCGASGAQVTTGPLCLDQNQNQIGCASPDCSFGDCTPPPMGVSTPAPAGVPTGSLLLYQGRWQTTTTLNVSTIISQVTNFFRQYGLQSVNVQTDGGALTVGNFNVMITLQVTGAGFAQPSDAGSIVDHGYYTATGHMPVFSSTVVQSAPGSGVPALVAGGTTAPPASPSTTSSALTWLESNALWVGLGLFAIVIGPTLARKL